MAMRAALAALLARAVAQDQCDPTTAVYWTTDYAPAHEASLLSLPLSLAAAAKHLPTAPRVVFAAVSADGAAWAKNSQPLSKPLACDHLYVSSHAMVPDDRLTRLVHKANPRRHDLMEHAGADNMRFYVFPALLEMGIKYALYLDVDCFAVRPLAPFFGLLGNSTLAVARTTATKTARPYADTKTATRLGYTAHDDFNAGVVLWDVAKAVKLDVPERLAGLYEVHLKTPLWDSSSVNQAAAVLWAKSTKVAFVDDVWNCKWESSKTCRIFHQKPRSYIALADASAETDHLLTACFGADWRARTPAKKHKRKEKKDHHR